MVAPTNAPTRLLKLPEVIERTSLSKSEVYRRIADGRFPPQIKLSPRKSVWRESDIEGWCASYCEGVAA